MIKQTFEIKWRDPETGVIQKAVEEFAGDDQVLPREWAEDFAYAKADKGWYSVKEIK